MRNLIRLLALAMALMLMIPAAMAEEIRGYDKKEGYVYLTFGTFPQTAEGGVEPILWRVLQVKDGRAYILTEKVIEKRRVHGDYDEYANAPTAKKNPGFGGDFTQTEVAKYLNGEFTENFTAGELALLSPDETLGMFTFLSSDELKDKNLGFKDNESRKAWATDYAIEQEIFVYQRSRGSHTPYWSRTQSTTNKQGLRCIKSKGELGYINCITENLGMRPACWLDMEKVVIASGSGTLEDPYVLLTEAVEAVTEAAPADEPCCEPGNCTCCTSCTCGCQ